MSANIEIQDKLRTMHLFAEFTKEELENFIELAESVKVKAGDAIVKQDEPGDAMYVIVSGNARVMHRQYNRKFELATLGTGDFFGEIALVDQGPRSADVEAAGECTLLRVTGGMVRALSGVYPAAAFKLLLAVGRVLVERMRRSNQKYIDSLLVGTH
jgi:CRP-like cAMP-binding protein